MPTIKVGTTLPMVLPGAGVAGVPPVDRAARYLEQLGLESLWVPDLIIGDGTPALEAALTLAAAAAVTGRIGLGFSVLTLPLRPVAWTAAQVATLQQLSGNRVLLGVGSGGFPSSPFWRAVGVPARQRGRLTDTALDLLPGLLAGEPTVCAPGQPPLTVGPAVPAPPVLVGGNSEAAIRRTLAYGDGWFPSLIAPEDLRDAVARLQDLAAQRGRPAPEITVGGHLILGDDESARTAYDALVRTLVDVHHMPPDKAAAVPMTARGPAELAEVFASYAAAGADRIVAGPDNGDWHTQLQLVADACAQLDLRRLARRHQPGSDSSSKMSS